MAFVGKAPDYTEFDQIMKSFVAALCLITTGMRTKIQVVGRHTRFAVIVIRIQIAATQSRVIVTGCVCAQQLQTVYGVNSSDSVIFAGLIQAASGWYLDAYPPLNEYPGDNDNFQRIGWGDDGFFRFSLGSPLPVPVHPFA